MKKLNPSVGLTACWLLLILLFTSLHCKKSPPPPIILPAVSQEGKNIFGCKVNGEIWIPYFQCTVFTGPCKELGIDVYSHDTLSFLPLNFILTVRNTAGSDTSFSSFDMYTVGAGISGTGNIIDSVKLIYTNRLTQYSNLSPNRTTGVLNLTKLDSINHIMSGNFSFTLYNVNGDSVVVSDGRFDLTFNTCLCH